MNNYLPFFFDYNCKYDFLKKSNIINIYKLISINQTKLFILNLNKKTSDRYTKIASFWSLELLSLQKAFFSYKLKQLRKSFYLPYSCTTSLNKKVMLQFLYNFLKEGIFSISHLLYFFVFISLRNIRLESSSTFSFFNSENKIFYNIGDFYLILKKTNVSNTLWLSLYKMIL